MNRKDFSAARVQGKVPRRPGRQVGFAFGLLAIGGLPLRTEESPGNPGETAVRLPEVVVTATRAEADPGRLPYATHLLDEEDLRLRLAPRSFPGALEELPGVSVQKTGAGLESPFLRGFTGFRTLLLIDGIRLNNAVFRDGPNQYWGTVDPLAIARVEAVMGPASVLYGSDAIGGTVNAITLENFPEGIHPGLYYRYASAEQSHTARADVRGLEWGSVGYSGGITWRDLGDIAGGRRVGEQRDTAHDALSGDAKASWMVSPRLRLTAVHQTFDQDDSPRTHSTIRGLSWRGLEVGTDRRRDFDQERLLSYLRAKWTPEARWLESVTLTISHHLQREREERVRSNRRRTRQGFEDHTGGAILQASTLSPIGRWTYGVEYYQDWVDSFRRDFDADGSIRAEPPRGPVADDSRYGLLGIFVQDRWAPAEWVELIAGGRYNWARAEASGSNIDPDPGDAQAFGDLSETFEALVGSARVIFHPAEWLSPFAGVSQGFRAPNLSDLTRFDVARSGEVELPATGLDPEKFITYEGGLHFRGEGFRATAAYFWTDVRDLIIRTPTGQVIDGLPAVTKENIGDGFVHGVELGAAWEFLRAEAIGGFTAFGSFSFVEGRIESFDSQNDLERRAMDKTPPTSLLLGLRWESPERKVWLEANLLSVLEQDQLSPADKADTQRIPPGGTPGYNLIGLRGGWRPTDRLRFFAGVDNITDQDYRVHGSGVNGPGIDFYGGAELRW